MVVKTTWFGATPASSAFLMQFSAPARSPALTYAFKSTANRKTLLLPLPVRALSYHLWALWTSPESA
eukprot:Skav219865  [mRNA]  locus=scaffold777:24378:25136:- [translate_table: standard]